MMIVDMESAFLQPRLKKDQGERLVVRPPPDLRKPGILWDMNVPLYGWRYASVSWQDHQAAKYEELGFRRNPNESCMYMRDGMDPEMAKEVSEKQLNDVSIRQLIHGDDNWMLGRGENLKNYYKDELSKSFVCTMKGFISMHEDDGKEGKFLRCKIRVTPQGWEYEADERHARNLLDRYGLSPESSQGAATPGLKPIYDETVFASPEEQDEYDPPLETVAEIKGHRGGVGTAGFLASDRLDIKYAVKEVQRDGSRPRASTVKKMKRLARYIQRVPRYVNVYKWQVVKRGTKRVLRGGVDADHAGCLRTRRSTHCVVIRCGGHVLLDVSATQPGLPAISSGESEYRGCVRCAVELLYVRNLLKFLRIRSEVILETDSTAAKGAANRLGAGKRMRHLEVAHFFLQGLAKAQILAIVKIKGTEHVPDLGTKYLSWPVMEKLLRMLYVKLLTFAGAAILPTCEAAEVGEVTISGTTLLLLSDQIDLLLEALRFKLVMLIMILVALKLLWSLAEKIIVEVTAERTRVLLDQCGCCRRRDERARERVIPMRAQLQNVAAIRAPALTQVHGCIEVGKHKVHLYEQCTSLLSRQESRRGTTKDICYYCEQKKKAEFKLESERFKRDVLASLEND